MQANGDGAVNHAKAYLRMRAHLAPVRAVFGVLGPCPDPKSGANRQSSAQRVEAKICCKIM